MTAPLVVYETKSVALVGLEPHIVSIRATIADGPPGTIIIRGLDNDAATRETRVRVASSLAALGYHDHRAAVAIDIDPPIKAANLGTFDLAIAVAVLGVAFPDSVPEVGYLRGTVLLGALALTGDIRPVRGTLPSIAGASLVPHVTRIIVPTSCGGEAAVATTWQRIDVPVYKASTLRELLEVLRADKFGNRPGEARLELAESLPLRDCAGRVPEAAMQTFEEAIRANKSVLLIASPGAGKTMLARRAEGLMPLLDLTQALQVASIQSVAGLREPSVPALRIQRPFRAPHHTVSEAGLVGGGTGTTHLGEVSLAHHGVLFLDEATEFRKSVLDALKSVLRQGEACFARRSHATVKFPAKPLLILAANPCPCGGWGGCKCSAGAKARHEIELNKLRAMVDVTIVF